MGKAFRGGVAPTLSGQTPAWASVFLADELPAGRKNASSGLVPQPRPSASPTERATGRGRHSAAIAPSPTHVAHLLRVPPTFPHPHPHPRMRASRPEIMELAHDHMMVSRCAMCNAKFISLTMCQIARIEHTHGQYVCTEPIKHTVSRGRNLLSLG